MMAMLLLQLTNPSSVLAFASFTSSFPSSSLLPIASQAPVMHKMINHVQHLLGQPKQNNQKLSKTKQAVKNNCYLLSWHWCQGHLGFCAPGPGISREWKNRWWQVMGHVMSDRSFVDTQRLNTTDTVWPTLLVRHTVDRGALLYHVQGVEWEVIEPCCTASPANRGHRCPNLLLLLHLPARHPNHHHPIHHLLGRGNCTVKSLGLQRYAHEINLDMKMMIVTRNFLFHSSILELHVRPQLQVLCGCIHLLRRERRDRASIGPSSIHSSCGCHCQ